MIAHVSYSTVLDVLHTVSHCTVQVMYVVQCIYVTLYPPVDVSSIYNVHVMYICIFTCTRTCSLSSSYSSPLLELLPLSPSSYSSPSLSLSSYSSPSLSLSSYSSLSLPLSPLIPLSLSLSLLLNLPPPTLFTLLPPLFPSFSSFSPPSLPCCLLWDS